MNKILLDALSLDALWDDFVSSLYQNNSFDISFDFHADFKNSRVIREVLWVFFDFLKLDWLWKNRFILVVDELVNNAIEHGSRAWDELSLRFRSWEENQGVCVSFEIEDSGTGLHKKSAYQMQELQAQKQHDWFKDHTSIRGRWLFLIISQLMDHLYFKDSDHGGLIVWVEKLIVAS